MRKSSFRNEWKESIYFSNLRTEKNLSVTFVKQLAFGKKKLFVFKEKVKKLFTLGRWEVNLSFLAIADFKEDLVNKQFAELYSEFNHHH